MAQVRTLPTFSVRIRSLCSSNLQVLYHRRQGHRERRSQFTDRQWPNGYRDGAPGLGPSH
jgi:hypothetical protein